MIDYQEELKYRLDPEEPSAIWDLCDWDAFDRMVKAGEIEDPWVADEEYLYYSSLADHEKEIDLPNENY